MDSVTDRIREEVRVALVRQRVSQGELADRVGLSRQHVSALLTGHRGKLPEAWERILDGLGLELVVRPKERPGA
jgi:transcriptional regulator with XRE-family HTH domain